MMQLMPLFIEILQHLISLRQKKFNKKVDIKRIIDNIYVNKRLLCIIPSTLKIKRPLN